jgi:hypothetical protein
MAGQTYPITVLGSDFVTPAMAAADPNCVASQLTVSVPTGSVILTDVNVIDSTKITATVQPMDTDPAEIATLTLWGAYFGPMVVKAPTRLGAMTKPDVAQAHPGPGALAKPAAALPADGGAPPGPYLVGQTTAAVLPIPVITWTYNNQEIRMSAADGSPLSTQNAVVGQQIVLTTTPKEEDLRGLGFQLTTNVLNEGDSWTVDGTIIGGYNHSIGSGSVKTADLTQTGLTSYWVYPSAQGNPFNVRYQYCVLDLNAHFQCSATANAKFSIAGPTGKISTDPKANPNISSSSFSVLLMQNCDTPPLTVAYLSFGQIQSGTTCHPIGTAGIYFTGNITSKGSVHGNVKWEQIVSEGMIAKSSPSNTLNLNCGTGLDNGDPYPAASGNLAQDSPGFGIEPVTYTSGLRKFSAVMYLMWQSSTPDSIMVPLASVQWGFHDGATGNALGTRWSVDKDSKASVGQNQAITSGEPPAFGYPTWTTHVTNNSCAVIE